MADQIDDHFAAHQGATPPVLCNVAKHPVLDLMPFARTWWKVTDCNSQPNIIRQLLQLDLPQPIAAPVGAAPISGDQPTLGPWIGGAPHMAPPASDRFHRKLGCIVIDSNTDPTSVGHHIIEP